MISASALIAVTLASGGPEVINFTITSGSGSLNLVWTAPALSLGAIVVRSTGTSPNTAPTDGFTYSAGATLGNGTVRYSGTATTFTDSGLTNGTRYYYRIFNRSALNIWSQGRVPTSTGSSAVPTNQTSPNPRWCYSTGLPLTQQPVSDPGLGVISAGSAGAVLSVDSTGTERFRPLSVSGTVAGRVTSVPLEGRTGRYGLVGDQLGFTYIVNLASGSIVVSGNLGLSIGDAVQAMLGAQLYAYANAAFKAAHPSRDLVFVATRNLLLSSNRVMALSSVTGLAAWTYLPNDLDMVNGGMLVDYSTNRLWIAARSASGTQSSMRIVSTLDGSEVARKSVGDIDTGIVKDFQSNQAYVVNTSGTAYGFDLSTGNQAWSASVGACSSYLYPIGNGFIASLSSGSVQRWSVSGSTATMVWSTAVPGPTGIAIDYTNQTLYVGASDGTLRKLALSGGAQSGSTTVSTSALGMPTIDTTAARIHVGTLSGDLCSYAMPL